MTCVSCVHVFFASNETLSAAMVLNSNSLHVSTTTVASEAARKKLSFSWRLTHIQSCVQQNWAQFVSDFYIMVVVIVPIYNLFSLHQLSCADFGRRNVTRNNNKTQYTCVNMYAALALAHCCWRVAHPQCIFHTHIHKPTSAASKWGRIRCKRIYKYTSVCISINMYVMLVALYSSNST